MARNFNLYILVLWFNCFKLLYSQVTLSVHFVIYSAGNRKKGKQVNRSEFMEGFFFQSCFVLLHCHTVILDQMSYCSPWHLSWVNIQWGWMCHSQWLIQSCKLIFTTRIFWDFHWSTHTRAHILYMHFNCNDSAEWWLKLMIQLGIMHGSRL